MSCPEEDPSRLIRLAHWIAKILVPKVFQESFWGDLEEDYAARFPSGMPPRHARQWFLRQLLAATPAFLVCRLRTEIGKLNWTVLLTSTMFGLAFVYLDSRPTWDDTGVLAFGILVATAMLGLTGVGCPWLVAITVGSWIPAYNIAVTLDYASLLALAIAFFGAYSGAALRRVLGRFGPSSKYHVSSNDTL